MNQPRTGNTMFSQTTHGAIAPPGLPFLTPNRRESLDERFQRLKVIVPAFVDMRAKLLSLGGVEVVLPHGTYGEAGWAHMRETVDDLLRRGQTWPGSAARMKPGAPSQCHANTAQSFLAGEGSVVNGYALSADGLWRHHSWLTDSGGLIETTVPRVLYHGYVHTDEEAVLFALGQLPEDAVVEHVGAQRVVRAFLGPLADGTSR